MALSPLACTDEVRESYINYLLAALPLRDPELRQQYEHLLREPGRMLKGPILEATPAFRPGATLEDLVGEGLLDRRFRGLGSFPSDRKLHVHQEQAIRRAAGGARNLVIATGTGSGKTECFLLPILQGLFEELQRGTLTPGVRALLLYPMNALANDQLATRARRKRPPPRPRSTSGSTSPTSRASATSCCPGSRSGPSRPTCC